MARINLTKVGVAVGVGAVDELLEAWDEKEGRTEAFKKATDIGRVIMALGGYAMQIFDFAPALGEGLAQSATPLLVKSIAKPIRTSISKSMSVKTTSVRRASFAPVSARVAAAVPGKTPAGEDIIFSIT